MRAVLKILLGGVYGYICYAVILWLLATAVPKLGLGGEQLIEELTWPKNVYMYFLPKKWNDTSTAESLLTIGGALLILRGLVAAAKKEERVKTA